MWVSFLSYFAYVGFYRACGALFLDVKTSKQTIVNFFSLLKLIMISRAIVFSLHVAVWWLPLLFAFLGARVVDVKAAGVDTTRAWTTIEQFKKSFTIGLAYFPNGTVDDWGI